MVGNVAQLFFRNFKNFLHIHQVSLDDYQITIHGTKSKPVDYESVISDELSDSHQTKLEAGQFNFKTVFFVIFIFNER